MSTTRSCCSRRSVHSGYRMQGSSQPRTPLGKISVRREALGSSEVTGRQAYLVTSANESLAHVVHLVPQLRWFFDEEGVEVQRDAHDCRDPDDDCEHSPHSTPPTPI